MTTNKDRTIVGLLLSRMPALSLQATDCFLLASAAEHRHDSEKTVGRNPHPDFAKVQASRPDWNHDQNWHFTKTVDPDWRLGCGANDGGESLKKSHVEIDPYENGRPAVFNYKLLISAIIPRPIGFVSTRAEDGVNLSHSPSPEFSSLIVFCQARAQIWLHSLTHK